MPRRDEVVALRAIWADHDAIGWEMIIPLSRIGQGVKRFIALVEHEPNLLADLAGSIDLNRPGEEFLMAVPHDEYISNSGAHELEVTVKPTLRLGEFDLYPVRVLCFESFARKRFYTLEEIAEAATRRHMDQILALRPRRVEYAAWRVRAGYSDILVFDPIDYLPESALIRWGRLADFVGEGIEEAAEALAEAVRVLKEVR